MAKKIIILNGSPRPKGNTSALAREFTKGAEEAGCAGDIEGHKELAEAYALGKTAAGGNGL